MISANRALEIAKELMTAQKPKQFSEYLAQWNELMVFLESLKRSENANTKDEMKITIGA